MELRKVDDCIWEIPQTGKMNVPGRIFASEALLEKMKGDRTLQQTANVATLPGILGYSIAMPDAHQGYGFPVGGVAAFDAKEGIISPGGVGFDINCGVRLMRTDVTDKELAKKRDALLDALVKNVPPGAGREGLHTLKKDELHEVLAHGAEWTKRNGFATKDDLAKTEEEGTMDGADPSKVSSRAITRGVPQLGTLGSGNHFLELQRVDRIVMPEAAERFGITKVGQVVVMVHCGSRGLGHQVCGDFIERIESTGATKSLADPELASAQLQSDIGQDYRAAMCSAINFAFANRQLIAHAIRQSFEKVMGSAEGVEQVYDVCHNIAKFEKHVIDGKKREVCVHRKGATRAFGAGRPEIPDIYRKIGQPVLIPGSMGTASYLLLGTSKSEEMSFGSTAHGAGRIMSRHSAIKQFPVDKLKAELRRKGIEVRGSSGKGLAEEAPGAYKDVDEVVRVSDKLGIGKIVARFTPLGVVKG